MDDYVKEALEIVKAQAGVRNMTEDEIASMVKKISQGIRSLTEGNVVEDYAPAVDLDPKKAIRDKVVVCLECGKSFKVLTKRHLASHGLSTEEYKEKYGYKKGTSLICKSLAKERRTKMKDMKLWERRGKKG